MTWVGWVGEGRSQCGGLGGRGLCGHGHRQVSNQKQVSSAGLFVTGAGVMGTSDVDVDLDLAVECDVDVMERDTEWVAVFHLTMYVTDTPI